MEGIKSLFAMVHFIALVINDTFCNAIVFDNEPGHCSLQGVFVSLQSFCLASTISNAKSAATL